MVSSTPSALEGVPGTLAWKLGGVGRFVGGVGSGFMTETRRGRGSTGGSERGEEGSAITGAKTKGTLDVMLGSRRSEGAEGGVRNGL